MTWTNNIDPTNVITAGTYEVSYRYIHPASGQECGTYSTQKTISEDKVLPNVEAGA